MSDEGLLFYRCYLCRSVVSKWDVEEHFACPKCGHTKVSPGNLTLWEKVVQIVKHPLLWRWDEGTNK
jgi:hypothetical protein